MVHDLKYKCMFRNIAIYDKNPIILNMTLSPLGLVDFVSFLCM